VTQWKCSLNSIYKSPSHKNSNKTSRSHYSWNRSRRRTKNWKNRCFRL